MSNTPSVPLRSVVLVAFSLLLMAGLDYITGQELVFSCAYLVPVSLTAWWFSRRAMVAMSFASGIVAFIVDELDGLAYSHPGIQYWNAFTCLLISLVTGSVLIHLKRALAERERMNAELREAMDKLSASVAEITNLQEGLQVMCAWTKQIKVGEEWMSPEEFLRTQLHIQLAIGISPAAKQKLNQQVDSAA